MDKHKVYSAIKRLLLDFDIFIENEKEFDEFMYKLSTILKI
jgi:hypothetical protein